MVLTKIVEAGYRPMEDVKSQLESMVKNEKKADKLADRLKNVKDLAQAKAINGAIVDSMSISFTGPTFVHATGTSEPVLSGSVASAGNVNGGVLHGYSCQTRGAFLQICVNSGYVQFV